MAVAVAGAAAVAAAVAAAGRRQTTQGGQGPGGDQKKNLWSQGGVGGALRGWKWGGLKFFPLLGLWGF